MAAATLASVIPLSMLPDLTYSEGVEDNKIPHLEYVPVANGTKYDDAVLSFCYYQARKVSEIAEYLGVSDSSYLRKQVLENLARENYVTKGKIGRAACYRTNMDMVELK